MAKNKFDYDLIVIGSGAGGGAAAILSAKAGKKVAIIEDGPIGGDLSNWGDIPTKALLNVAFLYDQTKQAGQLGLRTSTLGYNYPSIRNWKDLVVKRSGVLGGRKYFEDNNIDIYQGRGHFLTPHEISVNRRHLSAEYFLIASGSSWQAPEIPGLKQIEYFTPRTIITAIKPPKSLLIIGGGKDGVEIAQMMAAFGTKVSIVEKSSRLLPSFDPEVGELLEKVLEKQSGASIFTHSRVLSIQKEGLNYKAVIERGGEKQNIRTEEVLIATGKYPNVDLGLENASVEYSGKGITTNDYLQTSTRHIFAAGDVLDNDHDTTQSAVLESRIVANNITEKTKYRPDYSALPSIVFTNPEIATTGLSEDDCRRRDLVIKKAIAPLSMIVRSNTDNFVDGFIKIITDKKGVVLGATAVCPHASELIHELVLAVKWQIPISQIAQTPHAYLSWSEAVQVVAQKLSI